MGITAEDCWLCAVPLFHISGLSIVVRQLVLGCSIRLYDKFDEQQVTQDLQEAEWNRHFSGCDNVATIIVCLS